MDTQTAPPEGGIPLSSDDEDRRDSNGKPDYSPLFDAPDFSDFVRSTKTAVAREYERKTLSMLKVLLVGALDAKDFPDAAAIIAHGPGFAAATGTLADADERARKAIDLITSPANPYAMFILTIIPFISQIARNHEPVIAEVMDKDKRRIRRQERKARAEQARQEPSEPIATIPLPFGRKIPIRLKMRKLGIWPRLRSQTRDPRELTFAVFSDPKVAQYLGKQGIYLRES